MNLNLVKDFVLSDVYKNYYDDNYDIYLDEVLARLNSYVFTEASFIKGNRVILESGSVTAHEVDEFITIESFYKTIEQYKELLLINCK